MTPSIETISGCATPEGTARYRARRHPHSAARRDLQGLSVSSLGLGTYLGDPDEATDRQYAEAISAVIDGGINVFDTAINYRCQRSERVIGQTLAQLIAEGRIAREELLVCTKGGFLPFDGSYPANPARYVIDAFLGPGILRYDDLVANCHAISPSYLANQIQTSLKNLGLATIDVYYLHNPEQQLDGVPREVFMGRMEQAFTCLEQQVRDGAIARYGLATWHGFRANPQAKNFLWLESLVELARRVGGADHHFRVIQAPLNLAMPEAYGFKNQSVDGVRMSLLEAASRLGISIVASASLLQRQLIKLPPAVARLIPALETDAQRAIQFARSVPGVATALVGMKRRDHVEENCLVLDTPELSEEAIAQLFRRPENR